MRCPYFNSSRRRRQPPFHSSCGNQRGIPRRKQGLRRRRRSQSKATCIRIFIKTFERRACHDKTYGSSLSGGRVPGRNGGRAPAYGGGPRGRGWYTELSTSTTSSRTRFKNSTPPIRSITLSIGITPRKFCVGAAIKTHRSTRTPCPGCTRKLPQGAVPTYWTKPSRWTGWPGRGRWKTCGPGSTVTRRSAGTV